MGGEFEAFLRGPSTSTISSRSFNWRGVVLEHHVAPPGERPETVLDRFVVGVWGNQAPIGKYTIGSRRFQGYKKSIGSILLAPPGIIRPAIILNQVDITMCALDPRFVSDVTSEQEQKAAQLEYRSGFQDPPTRAIVDLLRVEASTGGRFGRLYTDHLAHALVIRLLYAMDGHEQKSGNTVQALPPYMLRRVLERMENSTDDLDLRLLAAETGYSRHHFLRMFHKATGVTPHQYLMNVRLKRAQELLRSPLLSLIDIAAECGFSSHAHMSKVFRQLLGTSPSEYRRNL